MIKEALEYVVSLRKTEVIEVNGRKYFSNHAAPVEDPVVNIPFKLTTLQGVVDYINNEIDMHIVGNVLTVHIESPTKIKIFSVLGQDRVRELLVEANAVVPDIPFGRYLETEDFIIEMLTKFYPTEDSEKIMKLVGNIREEHVSNTSDNGISQTVQARKGIAMVENVEVPNPVTLAPYRTFPELIQPTSLFVFRLKDGPMSALFNAGGTGWRNNAMMQAKTYIEENLNKDARVLVRVIM